MSFHFLWYVERHISPHGLRVMVLQTPKGKRSQRACKEEIII
jgi:hypothetical protein